MDGKIGLLLRRLAIGVGLLTSFPALGVAAEPVAYDTAMVDLLGSLHDYVQARRPGFGLLANGGAALYLPHDGNTPQNASKMLQILDGQLVESVFYGSDLKDGEATKKETSDYYKLALQVPLQAGLPVFNIDYVLDAEQQAAAQQKNSQCGYISWASTHRKLDYIPQEPPAGVNDRDVRALRDVRNFLVLLNPGQYARETYFAKLEQSPYDLLILDLYCEDRPLTAAEVQRLQHKPQGGRRLVYAYMSVGEAETYRAYWRPEWQAKRPDWMAEENEDWGSHRVKYWRPEWQAILYGSPSAYLDTIMQAGFDGAFLDVIDVYQYFRDRR
ncbi:cysteinyl-tRNA synthetase, unknown class [Selenomonas sp. GACV-9]|uniref:endo alpha-1,4 polygalactosaminidase n=1 Tax=Selenomonas sp. GACV-9 TaxID=3158782 RepID=UPI0008E1D1F1|nr:cysteinyl-tRNA synthetase, unknown class [Selenomonas ruminantium]